MRLLRLTLVPLLAVLLISCGGSDDKKPSAPTSPAANSAWLTLLDAVPDSSEARQLIVLNDYEALRKLAGEDAPKDPAAVAEYRRKVLVSGNAAMPSHISGLGQYFDPHLWVAQAGFHGGQVDADIQTGRPPNDVEALLGRFDASAIDAAIDKDASPLRSVLTRTSREGATLYVWGEDNKVDVKNRSVLRPLGRGERLALKGNTLFWAHSTPPINDMIDAAAGKKPSLADTADIKALLGELSKQSIYTAMLSNEVLTPDLMDVVAKEPSVVKEARDASFKEALKPYTMLGIGYGRDAEGPYSVLVLQHSSEALAQENLTKLKAKIDNGRSALTQTAWRELITKYDASANGVFVTAKMRTVSPAMLGTTFFNRDSLLVRE
jgi:hypothetical protein